MRRAFTLTLSLGLGLAAATARAEDAPPTAFTCEFKSGTSWSYNGGKFTSIQPEPLTLELDNIDLDAQSAAIKTGPNSQPGTIAIARAIGANHFLEVATEGFWNITTIYEKDEASGVYPAVHSRHLGLAGQPVFAQYAGTCKAR